MVDNLYTLEVVKDILNKEERLGHLRTNSYSERLKSLSKKLKAARLKSTKDDNVEEYAALEILRKQYEELRSQEQELIYQHILEGKKFQLTKGEVNEKPVYMANSNPETMVVARIMADEIRRSYRIQPANRDVIVEQMRAILDNNLPKILIRGDVQHFYESISQQELMTKIQSDGYLSRQTQKNLRILMYQYNRMSDNKDEIGIPRGLAFSAYLSEVYLKDVDDTIAHMDGVYFYKRYVDDIIVIANPKLTDKTSLWNAISKLYNHVGLTLHQKSNKCVCRMLDSKTKNLKMDYLGYQFHYSNGRLEVGISAKRYAKYMMLIDAIFNIYQKCSHYRSQKSNKKNTVKRQEALKEFSRRLFVLTGNGKLSSRKSYVSTGVYYTNRLITNTQQLEKLDRYLSRKIDNDFKPRRNMFQYNGEDHYEESVAGIKKKLHTYSFCRGFNKPNTKHKFDYAEVVKDLQKIYYSC